LGFGFGCWGLGFWGLAPNPQPPIPNPHIFLLIIVKYFNKKIILKNKDIK